MQHSAKKKYQLDKMTILQNDKMTEKIVKLKFKCKPDSQTIND